MQVNLPGLRIREWLQDPNCLLLHYMSSLSWQIQILKQRMHHWKTTQQYGDDVQYIYTTETHTDRAPDTN